MKFQLYVPLLTLGLAATTFAAPPTTQEMDLLGNRQFDGWSTSALVGSSNPGFGGFPGSGAWPRAITSETVHGTYGNGDAGLYKVKNGAGGGPYPAGGSIYYGGFSGDTNVDGGTLATYDTTPIANLKTVVFQVVIGEAWTYDLWNHAAPVLKVNGGTVTNGNLATSGESVAFAYSDILERQHNGTVTMPSGEEDVYINLRAYQWDLSSIVDPITSFSIEFTGVQHAQLYALQLDQSDAFMNYAAWQQPVPEPATIVALSAGALALMRRRKKNSA